MGVVNAANGSIIEGELIWSTTPGTAIVFKSSASNTSGGFLRLRGGGEQTWSTLDLGKASGAAGAIDTWVNSSHQGLSDTAAEPTRGLALKKGDRVGWRLLYRQGLYEIYFRHGQTFYFGAAYGA